MFNFNTQHMQVIQILAILADVSDALSDIFVHFEN